MKKSLLIILGIALTFGLSAQVRFGVKLGGTLSQLSNKVEGESENSDPKIGFQVGGLLEYSFSESFALQPELLYVNNGGKFGGGESEDVVFNLHNIQLPVNLKYKLGTDKLKFYVTGGPYLGYIAAARLSAGAVSINVFDDDAGTDMKHFDFGVGAGFGIELSNKYVAGVGYQYGLANLTGSEGAKMKSGTFNLSIGYLF
ncbi:MAG: PorT family protein [Prevotellaceae bacterium]|jgi:opacity protein-like surface antigen|nr:PorT family protein [Prevotellaceae bacterium]